MCKYNPDSIEACKKRLGWMVIALDLVKGMLTLVPVIILAYIFNLV